MQTRQLTYFLAVVDHGGFGRAAEALRIAQPSLSQAIAAFERELGTPLFHRVGRGVVLSTSGADLVGPARDVLRSLDHAQAAIDASSTDGHLDIMSTPTPGVEPLTGLLAAFAAVRPTTRLELSVGFTPERVLEAVRTGESEIGVLGSPVARNNRGLRTIQLEPQPLVLISRPGDPIPPGPVVHARDMSGLRLIVPQESSLIRSAVDDMIESGDLDAIIVAEVSLRASIVPMVLGGIGQAVLASGWRELAEKAGGVVQTIVPEQYLHIAVVSREGGLTPTAAAFMNLTETTARSAP
jgi:DNA-binding transcriptional LysR family regulator